MTLEIFTDGGSKGNPGPAAIGVAAYANRTKRFAFRADMGTATNNEAEYTAFIKALEHITAHKVGLGDITKVHFYADSEFMVKQLRREYKVTKPHIKTMFDNAQQLLTNLPWPFTITHVKREQNAVADGLVNGIGAPETQP